MTLYTITIHDPETRENVHTLAHKVRAPSNWQAVKAVVEAYGFTRAWVLRAWETKDAFKQAPISAAPAAG